jgi:hypothetical protein
MPIETQAPLRPHWDRPSAIATAAGFGVSLVVHSATYFGFDLLDSFPLLWGLHLAAIVAFGAMIRASRSRHDVGQPILAFPRWPSWAYLLAFAGFTYAFVNFIAFLALSHGGTPESHNGVYVLSDHGRVIRTLTPDQYRWQQVYVVRGFSGHWMFFLLLPMLYFLFRENPATPSPSAAPAV